MMRLTLLPMCLVATAALADTAKLNAPSRSASKSSGYSGLGAESLSPQEIAKYAAPPLDERMSRRIQAMLDVRGSTGGRTTSKGDRQIFTTRITGTDQVWRQDGPMKFPVQLTGGEDRTSVVALAPDDSFAVVSRDIGGGENAGVYLLAMDGGPLKVVQHTPKVQTFLQYISDDSKSLYFRSNDKDPASYTIYRYDVATEKRDTVFDEKGLWVIADHRGDSTWLMVKELGSTQQEIYEYDLKSRKLTPVLGQGETEQYDVTYGARPGQILVRTNKLGDFQRLYVLEGGKLTPVSPEIKHDIEELTIDPARTRIYYRINEDGYWKLAVLDARTFKPLALPRLPSAENVSLASVSHNGRFAELSFDGSTLVPQTVTYDWQTGKLTTWRVPSTPEIDTRAFAKASLEYYPARDGTKIPMFVRRPARCDGPCPVIVEFHGGPEAQALPGFSTRAQMFVDAGFTFVQPNVRGSAGYGKAWLHADDGPRRLDVITDIEDAAKFIRASWGKDGRPPKIGVTGGSYGGYSVLMAQTYFAGAYDVAVEQVGISNLVSFLANTSPYRRILRISEYGDPVKDREALIQLSPITHIAKIKAPLLLIAGVNDPRVPVGEGLQIYKQLEQRKIPSGLILFPDEGHGARKRGNIVLATGHTIAFFEKYLLGK
ncbi:MAG TPA: prolyl oligopeptidase family serine peptidase [Kofleriaceae bacterium]|nr:prolyl oligopeptidase family serine peptidase [Kofleriaceae bacterium]